MPCIPSLSAATHASPALLDASLSWPPTGRQTAWKPAGGFVQCPTHFLTLPWGLYQDGHLSFLGLRTWYGVLELRERRCGCTPETEVHYGIAELHKLVQAPRRTLVQTAVHQLETLGLLRWSTSRIECLPEPAAFREHDLPTYQALQAQIPRWRTWVPVPRRMLRWLACEGTPGLCATVAGVLLRCLWSKDRQCVSGGRVAAHWIATGFGLAKRTVQRALDDLQACGWLARLPSTTAQEVARERQYGGNTVVNLAWDIPRPPNADAPDETPGDQAVSPSPAAAVEHIVKHVGITDQNVSPLAPDADQNMSPSRASVNTFSPVDMMLCDIQDETDFYPFQEEKPHGYPLCAPKKHTMGIHDCEKKQNAPTENPPVLPLPNATDDYACVNTPTPTHIAEENPIELPTTLPPTIISMDPATVFAALPPAEQEALQRAARERLLAKGISEAFLITPVVHAEVYAQMALPPTDPPAPMRCEAPAAAATPAAPRREVLEHPTCSPPHLSHVVPEDLVDITRLEVLRQQAIMRGWVTGSEADHLNVVAAAVHARQVGDNPCALFVTVVRTRRWEVITQDEEDQARALVRAQRWESAPQDAEHQGWGQVREQITGLACLLGAKMTPRPLSDDARFV